VKVSYLKFLALGGVIGPVLFTLIVLICASLRPEYNHITHLISELGATGTQLTQFYLDRINSISIEGPELNAVLTINPDTLKIAAQLDEEIQNGTIRGSLHGIPVLLKDNIDTGDKMPCTAGSRAMKDSYPLKDSSLAAQLRKAGAVILGKANVSEWANQPNRYYSYIFFA